MGDLIEWLDGNTLCRGTLKKADKTRFQVLSLHGRTLSVPVKKFHLRHNAPGEAAAYFEAIDARAVAVDLALLYETLGPGGTFSLEELAACWFSDQGSKTEELSVLLSACSRGAPWFKVDAAGRVITAKAEDLDRHAREEEVRRAAADEERKLAVMLEALSEGRAPAMDEDPALFERLIAFLEPCLKGEDSMAEWPALKRAAAGRGDTAALAMDCLSAAGRLPDPYRLHMNDFHRSFFGSPLPAEGGALYPEASPRELQALEKETERFLQNLPPPRNRAVFSIDDEGVEEIDDALSLEVLEGGNFRVGVHIAAPGLFIAEGTVLHETALKRATTVYQPDVKWTMLPRRVIQDFTLKEGEVRPAVSTYFVFSRDGFRLLKDEARLEAVRTEANLSYGQLEACLEGGFFPDLERLDEDPGGVRAWLDEDPAEFPWRKEKTLPAPADGVFDLLLPLARRLFTDRVRGGAPLFNRWEYKIKVLPGGEVSVTPRRRNSLVEGVVSELMILTNIRTASCLAKADMPGIYRSQQRTGADLTVSPREHAGLGHTLYCWSTSPLRRYADLINQRQLGSLIQGFLPPFADLSELLVRAKKAEFQGAAADAHQRRMERFFVLKHLERLGERPHPVEVVRIRGKEAIRFLELPLTLPLAQDGHDPGEGPARFVVERIDFYQLNAEGRLTY